MPAGAPMADYRAIAGEPGLVMDPLALVRALGVARFDFSQILKGQSAFAPYMRGAETSWIVDVSGGYHAYEAAIRERGSVLKDIDRKRRKIEREIGACQFTAMSPSSTDFQTLIALKRTQLKQTNQPDIFAAGWTMNLIQALFELRDLDFGGALFTLRTGDRLAAVHFHLRSGTTVQGWLIAHAPEFERYSPGLLLFQDILKWMAGGSYSRQDLGCGDYRIKRDFQHRAGDWSWFCWPRIADHPVARPRPSSAQGRGGPGLRRGLSTTRQGHAPL